jgi:hypothetical protein
MLALIGLLLLPLVVHARDVNKCVDAQGNIMLTDEPCHTVTPRRPPDIPPKPAQPMPPTAAPQALPPILPPPQQVLPQAPKPAPVEKPAS